MTQIGLWTFAVRKHRKKDDPMMTIRHGLDRCLIIGLVILMVSGCRGNVEYDGLEVETIEEMSLIEETTVEAEATFTEPELTLGDVIENHYSNDYFNVTFEVPDGWGVLSENEMTSLMTKGQQVLEQQNNDVANDLAAIDVLNLFGVFRYPISESGRVNPSLIITAEKLVDNSGIIDGKTYLEASKKILEQTGLPYDLGYPSAIVTTDFREYGEFYGTIQARDQEIRQRYVAFVSNGYIVSCITTYEVSDGESGKTLTGMMNDVLRK